MNQFIVKKNYLFSFKKYFNYFLNLIVIFYPFFIISGPAALEFASAIFLLVGLYYFFYNKLYLKFNIYLIFFLLFYISANFSSFLSNDQYSAFGRSLFLFRIPFIIFGILFILSKNQYVFKYTIYSILFCFIFIYFDDLLQFFTGFDIFNFPKINHRLSGPFNDELIPGKFLFRFGLISICIIFIIFKNYHFNFFLITSFFLLIGVILTGEKTSSLLTLFSIITFSIFRFNFYKNIIALLFSLFIFVCSFFLLINTNKMYYERIWIETNRIIPIFNNRTFIDSEYGLMIVTAYNIWLDNRIFGVGLKNYRSVCADNKYSNINSLVVQNRCSTHPHNFYAELLSELGLSGLLLFLSIIIKLFYDLINIYFTNKDYFLLSFIIILFFIFLPISLSSSLFNNFNILWISYIISLTIYISKNKYVI